MKRSGIILLSFMGLFASASAGVSASASASTSASANEDLFTGTVFRSICEGTVTPLPENKGWALHRPEIAITEDASTMYFTERNFGKKPEWTIAFTADGESSKVFAATPGQPRDLKVIGENLWVLFPNELLVLSRLSGEEVARIATTLAPIEANYERASEMTLVGDRLYIAHGSHGVSVVDTSTMKHVKTFDLGLREQKGGHWSGAVGIASQGEKLIVMAERVTFETPEGKAFNGLIVTDAKNLLQHSYFPVNERSSGILSGVLSSQVIGDTLVINNWGIQHSVELGSLKTPGKQFNLVFKPTRIDYEGRNLNVELMGDMNYVGGTASLADATKLYVCGKIGPDDVENRIPIRKGIVFRE